MECPYCGEGSRVLDSRRSGEEVRRRRECQACGRRFTTYERVAPPEIRVTKRGGRTTEDFDHGKLLRSVLRVTRGRRVTRRACEDLVRGLEAELLDQGVQTVASWQLAERLLARLGELDRLAAARYASNYTEEDGTVRPGGELTSPQLALPLAASAAGPEAGAAVASPAGADEPPEPRSRRGRRPGR